jgi:hypothetical protein
MDSSDLLLIEDSLLDLLYEDPHRVAAHEYALDETFDLLGEEIFAEDPEMGHTEPVLRATPPVATMGLEPSPLSLSTRLDPVWPVNGNLGNLHQIIITQGLEESHSAGCSAFAQQITRGISLAPGATPSGSSTLNPVKLYDENSEEFMELVVSILEPLEEGVRDSSGLPPAVPLFLEQGWPTVKGFDALHLKAVRDAKAGLHNEQMIFVCDLRKRAEGGKVGLMSVCYLWHAIEGRARVVAVALAFVMSTHIAQNLGTASQVWLQQAIKGGT